MVRIDLAPSRQQPGLAQLLLATLGSLALSLLADALLVKAGTSVFPSTRGYSHFRFSDYGTLTIVGICVACCAWPIVTRLTSTPRWLFLRLAVVVTLVLWLPDVWLLAKGEPPRAVAVLMVMHLAIALVTYNALVHLAPVGKVSEVSAEVAVAADPPGIGDGATGSDSVVTDEPVAQPRVEATPASQRPTPGHTDLHWLWVAMTSAVGLEFVLGIVGLMVVPTSRPNGWIPAQGADLYLAHAVLGAALTVAALGLVVRSITGNRMAQIGSVAGLVGLAMGAVGGGLAAYHHVRSTGLILMFLGTVVAVFGYLVGTIG